MSTRKTILGLVGGLALPGAAMAFGADGDPIAASFERDLNRHPAVGAAAGYTQRGDDPYVNAILAALASHDDPIVASFRRDLKRAPATGLVLATGASRSDPLVRQIRAALPDAGRLSPATVAQNAKGASHR